MFRQRVEALKRLFEAHVELFVEQGAVTTTWRSRNGRRRGPYYALKWREDGRLRFHYLGTDKRLANLATKMFDAIRSHGRRRRFFAEQQAAVRRMIRHHKAQWRDRLAAMGLSVKGLEVRGWRRMTR